jgi:hypothetical protein
MATSSSRPVSVGVNRSTLIPLGAVLFAGAIGGLLFFVVAKMTGTSLPAGFGFGLIPVLMFVGALAAAFGVYLLTASDLKAIRTYVFAVVCGLAWKSMIDAAVSLAANATASSQTAQVGDTVDQVQAATLNGNAQQINTAVASTVSAVNQALSYSPNVSDSSKKAEIIDTSNKAIAQLQFAADKSPDVSVDALKNISTTASSTGQTTVALQGVYALRAIGEKATSKNENSLAGRVQESLAAVAAASKNPLIQTAAKNGSAAIQSSIK